MISNTNKRSSKFRLLACLPIVAMLFLTFSCNKEVISASSPKGEDSSMEKDTPPTRYRTHTCDFDENGMVILQDGKKVTVDEMKDIIVKEHAAKGKFISKDNINIQSIEEMERSQQESEDNLSAIPELGKYRLMLAADGKISVMEDLGNGNFGPWLKIKSYEILLQNQVGEENGTPMYRTVGLSMTGHQFNDTVMRAIDEIDKKYLAKSKLTLKNIIVIKDGEDYIIKEEPINDLTLFE